MEAVGASGASTAAAKGGVSSTASWSTNIFRNIDTELQAKINIFHVFGTLRKTIVLFTTTDDICYIFDASSPGSSGSGDAGSGDLHPIRIPELSNKGIISVTSATCEMNDEADFGSYNGDEYGDEYEDEGEFGVKVQALTDKGHVYEWAFCIRQVNRNNIRVRPLLVQDELSGKQLIHASCSLSHSVAVLNNGALYAWGANNSGQLGTGNISTYSKPVKVLLSNERKCHNISTVVCIVASSYALTKNGLVFEWGRITFGQSNLATQATQNKPRPLPELEKFVVVKIAGGHDHVLALTDNGDVYHWGNDERGQLGGRMSSASHSCRPKLCSNLRIIGRITDIAAYRKTFAAMNKSGTVYVWGTCSGNKTVNLPTHFSSLDEALVCFAGGSSSSLIVQPASSPSSSFFKSFQEALDNPDSADLKVSVAGKTIHVHKSILQVRSPHFNRMFQGKWKESSEGLIEIDGYSYAVYYAYLKYLYTNEVVDGPTEELSDLLDLANSYLEVELKQRCSDLIKQKLSVQNVAAVYERAVVNKQKDLEERCIRFAAIHSSAVFQSDAFANMIDFQMTKVFVREIAKHGQ